MPKMMPGYREEARKNIIEAAIAEANEKGFSNFTMGNVANRLGISRTTIYIYFRNREEMLDAAIEHIREKLSTVLKKAFSGDDLEESLNIIYDFIVQRDDEPEMNAIITVFSRAAYDEKTASVLRKNFTGMHDLFQAAIDSQIKQGKISSDVDPDIAAYMIQIISIGSKMSIVGGLDKNTAKKVWKLGLRKILAKE